ncbi:unnamed protein product [Callosobruchus maculatus]|uniref:Uncharacterized protein n=1 Tax=Callosobruchus maculatus TaxID=64391 RepID=A0A653DMG9_CALMS|nr:unnamed protein product [Callosobruchus maculatus]
MDFAPDNSRAGYFPQTATFEGPACQLKKEKNYRFCLIRWKIFLGVFLSHLVYRYPNCRSKNRGTQNFELLYNRLLTLLLDDYRALYLRSYPW